MLILLRLISSQNRLRRWGIGEEESVKKDERSEEDESSEEDDSLVDYKEKDKSMRDERMEDENIWRRLKENEVYLEGEKMGVEYYMAQSCHGTSFGDGRKRFEVMVWIDDRLDSNWRMNIKEALRIISYFVPGFSFKIEVNKEDYTAKPHTIFITTNDRHLAFTEGSIFTTNPWNVSLWNSWDWHRQGTALHEILHGLGFNHEQSRKDRDKYLKIKEIKNINYTIDKPIHELTPFDPFSVMLYNEDEKMERIGDIRIWKLK